MTAFLPTLQIQVKIIEEVVSKPHLVRLRRNSCVAPPEADKNAHLPECVADCAFSSACALLSNAI